jgi:hypothetical protein
MRADHGFWGYMGIHIPTYKVVERRKVQRGNGWGVTQHDEIRANSSASHQDRLITGYTRE